MGEKRLKLQSVKKRSLVVNVWCFLSGLKLAGSLQEATQPRTKFCGASMLWGGVREPRQSRGGRKGEEGRGEEADRQEHAPMKSNHGHVSISGSCRTGCLKVDT